jgi:hypothetical protein
MCQPRGGDVLRLERPQVDQLLSHRLIASDLDQLAFVQQITAAVSHLKQEGLGPHTEVESQCRSHAPVLSVVLASAHQIGMTLDRCILQRFGESPHICGAGSIVAVHAAGDVLGHGFERDSACLGAFSPTAYAISDHRQKRKPLRLAHQ